jgi:hypothetical protein
VKHGDSKKSVNQTVEIRFSDDGVSWTNQKVISNIFDRNGGADSIRIPTLLVISESYGMPQVIGTHYLPDYIGILSCVSSRAPGF